MLGLASTISSSSTPESKYSLNFDGTDDYLDLGLIDFDDNNFSCSFWFKVADGVTWTQYAALFNNRNSGGESIGYQIRFTGTVGEVMLFSDFGGTTIKGVATGLAVDTWHHIAATVDRAGNQVLYANGSDEYTEDLSGQSSVDMTNALNLIIGKAGSTEVQAKIADLAIWNVALDADAVTAIYNGGKPTNLTFDDGGYYDNSSALVAYYKMGNGSFDDKVNGVIHDQHNPGFGAELIPNNDFSANEAESQANLVGGVQFDNWVENPGTGKRAFSVIENGFRSTCVEASDSSWQQRVSQDLHSILTVGDVYRFNCDYLTSDGSSIRVAIQTPGSSDIQIGGTQSTSAGVKYTLNGYFTCSATTNIDVDLWPTAVQSAGEYFEISNVSLKKLNGFPGLTSGGPTFSSDTPQ
jgi:hypothetical protein